MKLRGALLAATVLSLPFAANAQPVTGLYIGAGVGANYSQQQQVKNLQGPNLDGFGDGLSLSGDLKGAWGFVGLASIGWGFGNGLRAEVEGNFRQATIGGFTNFGTAGGNLTGGTTKKQYGGMANVLYDFVDLVPYVQPYIGVGVGAIWVDYNNLHGTNAAAFNLGNVNLPGGGAVVPAGGLSVATNSTKTSFAYQAILGAALPLDQVTPGLALTAEYRFLGTTGNNSYNATWVGNANIGTRNVGTATAGKIQLGPNYNQAILVGLRYNFGVAPPAPPPAPIAAPAPAPARSYLVFFDWDKYNLTDRARQIIHEAAENSTHVQYTRIEVNGYTDTSGTPKYNLGLSIRRANAVAAELVKDGVPKSAISIQGFGDTHLLVPTGPGVREPQNRRVEIIIR
jgi:outer membrane protein OmpA-like peptidoglycan-associated protein